MSHTHLFARSAVVGILVIGAAGCAVDAGQSADDMTEQPEAGVGESCASGMFGTPNIPCADGLVCVYPDDSTAPSGPDGSSSAATGTCQQVAGVGESCASGTFGTPNILCADGLVCVYPDDSTAPSGPDGSSSATTGTCQQSDP